MCGKCKNSEKPKKKVTKLVDMTPEDFKDFFDNFGASHEESPYYTVALIGQPRELAETIRRVLQ
jgi:hypothetical protein